MRYTYTDAILALKPGATFWIKDDLYDTLQWYDEASKAPTEAAIKARQAQLQQAWDDAEYQRQRAAEYPSLADQLDALYHAGVFPQDMADRIAAVKARYPKPCQ